MWIEPAVLIVGGIVFCLLFAAFLVAALRLAQLDVKNNHLRYLLDRETELRIHYMEMVQQVRLDGEMIGLLSAKLEEKVKNG